MSVRIQEVIAKDGLRLPVHISSHGRPLLIVPGIANEPRASWDAVREHLEPHLTVAVVHRRGALGDPLSDLTMEQEFDDVVEVAKALGPEVDVLGHSSGALYALGAALLTTNLRRLILYEPPLEPLSPNADEYRERVTKLDALLRAGDIEGVYDAWWTVYLGLPREVAEGIMASPIDPGIRPMAKYIPREIKAHLAWEIDPTQFADITAPTLFLLGEETPMDGDLAGMLPLLTGVIPNLTVRKIPGQGHFAPSFAPKLFADIVLEFLRTE